MELFIENLKCSGCVNTVKKGLIAIAGVEAVEVDLAKGRIQIEGAVAAEIVRETLLKMGYPEVGHNTFKAKATSYISCAIGKIEA
ncbi:MAG: hypothetical protein RLZZ301_741 [Bacteroidota bacterium]|jgi:copper chaperone CopZ